MTADAVARLEALLQRRGAKYVAASPREQFVCERLLEIRADRVGRLARGRRELEALEEISVLAIVNYLGLGDVSQKISAARADVADAEADLALIDRAIDRFVQAAEHASSLGAGPHC